MTDKSEPTTTLEDLKQEVIGFINWIARNDFTDPEHMLVCAEWNLCGAIDMPMAMAGCDFEKTQLLKIPKEQNEKQYEFSFVYGQPKK